MSAYVIVDNQINDPELYKAYTHLSPATVAAYGGKFLARGGTIEVAEGDWHPTRLVIIEFESFEKAREWLYSPEYSAIKSMRQQAAHSNLLILDGVKPA